MSLAFNHGGSVLFFFSFDFHLAGIDNFIPLNFSGLDFGGTGGKSGGNTEQNYIQDLALSTIFGSYRCPINHYRKGI